MPEARRSISSSRSTLVSLLLDMPLGTPVLRDLTRCNAIDKLYLLSSSCGDMIAEAIWLASGANREEALRGLDALVHDVRINLKRRTNGKIGDW